MKINKKMFIVYSKKEKDRIKYHDDLYEKNE